ncbi:hypothetical protein [Rhodococcus erythropolis]|uniref:hypothetical protein n=1 Tax=Rhodococcus erythropolis TaxID=1833 RepID=UPI0008B61985|nr:hypothetical protein [Rhodococcus erythropolis]OFV77032.1 hypothetical protein RERY_21950 [Rhodococcus erythropolis]
MHIRAKRYLTAGVSTTWAIDSDDDGDSVVIDLTHAEFVDTLGLVTVAVVAEDAQTQGRKVDIKLPRLISPRNWLSRMHLRSALESIGLACDLGQVNETPLGDRILELHRFDSSTPDELADKVYAVLSADDPQEAGVMYSSVAEAAANVCDHSGKDGGWAALRQVGKGAKRRVEFAVADAGVGLRSSLANAHSVTNDVDAMQLAVTQGVSGTGLVRRGLGLSSIAETAADRSGQLRLFSGRATGQTMPNGELLSRVSPTRYPGTLVYANLEFQSQEVT